MIKTFVAFALGFSLMSAPLAAQDAPAPDAAPGLEDLSLEQRTGLRCAVAFGLIAKGQADGDPRAQAYPPLAERGREFFVRTMARLMDDKGLSREQANKLAFDATLALASEPLETREKMMPGCLMLLDASGL